ncbi:hypothetical protein QCA50_007579 [Cerrena zonata]|uniref:DUF6699 domain-containing protein n=1 Tax=Cerrena zonata TaxID=2478898 RepID=A0AAW0G6E0_9APHY
MDRVSKWAAGTNYGPVLTPTELYLLRDVQLELHPVMRNEDDEFFLTFNLSNGSTTGTRPGGDGRELEFTAKSEPATVPRVSELVIITHRSPWCTLVRNPDGVTCGDVCETLFQDYEKEVTPAEFATLNPRAQDSINRYRDQAIRAQAGGWAAGGYFSQAAVSPNRIRRADWLTDHIIFDKLARVESQYARQRLGFNAPNIICLYLTRY